MTTPAATEHARWEAAIAALGLTPHPAPGDDPSREVDGWDRQALARGDYASDDEQRAAAERYENSLLRRQP